MILCFQIKKPCKGKYPILEKPLLQPVTLIDARRSGISNFAMTLLARVLKEQFIRGGLFSQAVAQLVSKQNFYTVMAYRLLLQ